MASSIDPEKIAWITEKLKDRRCLIGAIVHGDNSMRNCTYVQGRRTAKSLPTFLLNPARPFFFQISKTPKTEWEKILLLFLTWALRSRDVPHRLCNPPP